MMNRSKTIAIIAGTLVLVGLAVAQLTDAKPFLGTWKGTLSIDRLELEIALHITLDEAGHIRGTIDSITQGAFGIALGGFAIKERTLSFVIADPNVPGEAAFKGALDDAGKRIAGEFTQSGSVGAFSVDKQ